NKYMARKDYYQILGAGRDADESAIKKAYRNLAMKYHPDRNQGKEKEANERFKEINEAYEVLGDPKKRKQYDQFGTVGTGDIFGSTHTRAGFEDVMHDFGAGGLGFDFLKNIFGDFEYSRGPGRVEFRTRRPSGRVFRSRVSLEDMLSELLASEAGTGTGTTFTRVPTDAVYKQTRKGNNDIHEHLTLTSEKARRGVKLEYKKGKKKIEIAIPPGVKTGQRMRYTGARSKLDSKTGDLYVHITVKN
ncbi:unnamed protein product, partial [marine sediment metagenome]